MVGRHNRCQFALGFAVLLLLVIPSAYGRSTTSPSARKKSHISESSGAQKQLRHVRHRRRHRHHYERFYTSSFADDVTSGDITAGEDLAVRSAAIDALGNMNGTVVAIDSTSGRVLAMVNQKLAL